MKQGFVKIFVCLYVIHFTPVAILYAQKLGVYLTPSVGLSVPTASPLISADPFRSYIAGGCQAGLRYCPKQKWFLDVKVGWINTGWRQHQQADSLFGIKESDVSHFFQHGLAGIGAGVQYPIGETGTSLIARAGFSGGVAVSMRGQIIYTDSSGFEDLNYAGDDHFDKWWVGAYLHGGLAWTRVPRLQIFLLAGGDGMLNPIFSSAAYQIRLNVYQLYFGFLFEL